MAVAGRLPSSDGKDTAIGLYEPTEKKRIGYDNDGGGGVDPRLELTLSTAKHYLAVEELFGLGSRPTNVKVSAKMSIPRSPASITQKQ